MASSRDCPLISSEETGSFFVENDEQNLERVRRQFQKEKLYYLGSHQGCGCGFQREHDWNNDDVEMRNATREDQRRLAAYLSDCLENEESVELYGCWSGDEKKRPVRSRELAPEDFLEERFFFIEKEHITVKKNSDKPGESAT